MNDDYHTMETSKAWLEARRAPADPQWDLWAELYWSTYVSQTPEPPEPARLAAYQAVLDRRELLLLALVGLPGALLALAVVRAVVNVFY